jgi:hypothetical protein
MPDANALNFLALQDAVLGRRVPAASQRNNAKRWLATAYQDVWSAAEWTFKRVSRADLATIAGDSTPVMPVDFQDVLDLYDSFGEPLLRLSQERFEYEFGDILAQSQIGLPDAYTVVNRRIEIAPVPGGETFKLSYLRRLSSRTASLVVQAGFMVDDDDYPLWDDHHSVLIPRALAIGLLEINDPTWQEAQEEYERQLARMRDDYVQINPARQWGAVSRYG